MDKVYVSLGSDCSIAYNLQKHNLRTFALPFDWIQSRNYNSVEKCIYSNFQYFMDKSYLKIVSESDKFPLFEDDYEENTRKHVIVVNTYYDFYFCHDFNASIEEELDVVSEKYNRRIDRFNDLLGNKLMKKVFVRIDNKINDMDYDTPSKEYVNIDTSKMKFKSWKKEELNWLAILK